MLFRIYVRKFVPKAAKKTETKDFERSFRTERQNEQMKGSGTVRTKISSQKREIERELCANLKQKDCLVK
jgi:hypothetical protein